jgi:hypothetical protein
MPKVTPIHGRTSLLGLRAFSLLLDHPVFHFLLFFGPLFETLSTLSIVLFSLDRESGKFSIPPAIYHHFLLTIPD